MSKNYLTKSSKMLLWIGAGVEVLSSFLVSSKELRKRSIRGNLFKSTENFDSLLHYLLRNGYINYVDKNNERFVKITRKGELKILMSKAGVVKTVDWDGKWRLIIFDIPEESSNLRDRFRELLKTYDYKMLQGSVFINPYPLNREAVKYLKESGLIKYIRMLKIEEMDDDGDLKKYFGLAKK
jgi:DNA-binding transcriptional regulator PaaX